MPQIEVKANLCFVAKIDFQISSAAEKLCETTQPLRNFPQEKSIQTALRKI